MSNRWGAIAVAIAIAGCANRTSPVAPATAAEDPLACEPAPMQANLEVPELVTADGRLGLVIGAESYFLMVTLDCAKIDAALDELGKLAEACADGPCGAAIDAERLGRLADGLAAAQWTPAQIGGIQVATGTLEGQLVVGWPRGQPIEPVLEGIGPQRDAAPTAPEQRCCVGCAPCLPEQCGSTPPPTTPRRGLAGEDACQPCADRIAKYCPDGGPSSDPDCRCAVSCCTQASSGSSDS
jgi:hypothetical protein